MRLLEISTSLLLLLVFVAPGSEAEEAPRAAPTLFEPGLVSTGFDDAHVSFSPDGETLYFLRNSPDFAHWTVLVSRRDRRTVGTGGGRSLQRTLERR